MSTAWQSKELDPHLTELGDTYGRGEVSHRRNTRRKGVVYILVFRTVLILSLLALCTPNFRAWALSRFEAIRSETFGVFEELLSRHFLSAPDDDFSFLATHCADAQPISANEFKSRQRALAETLHALNASAYIAEPGANAGFFANISAAHWSLSERPLLLIITPSLKTAVTSQSTHMDDGALYEDEVEDVITGVNAKVTILTPSFEKTRAKLLPVPSADDTAYVEWPEDASPYEVAAAALRQQQQISGGTVFVDGSIRKFIADGLAKALPGTKVVSAPPEIRQLRERKSPAEIELLRCANEVTLLALRAVRERTRIGMHESTVRALITKALTDAGLSKAFALTLFGENAALPHGGGTDRILGLEDFVLIDCGGSLHGYQSDITRTYALPESRIHTTHLSLWFTVLNAQSAAHLAAQNDTLTHVVDDAARHVIARSGNGKYFTHRLGHGIGLEGHEDPYLRGGSADLIRPGHAFSNEPGIYIEGDVGIRLEDIFYINEEGKPVFLTANVGGQAKTPWDI
ncbi:Creatinase/aminopeptidase [Schizopora paradoxa]|uniref:Creatinase/aminopeptidase n=1 Tax=Schizopora paradoxa TaxID=27342 RepID=A0A0H2RQB4_9AGAM|nr:Creatinase/aminopeptidase [Schizopora paradoxa]